MVTFRQGQDGYAGNSDAYMRQEKPTSNYGDGGGATSAHHLLSHPDTHDRSTVIEFVDIFGEGPGQVPAGQVITSAALRLYAYFVVMPGNGQAVSAAPLLVSIPDYGNRDSGAGAGMVCWAYRAYDDTNWGGDTNDGPVAGLDYDDSQAVTAIVPGDAGPEEVVDAGWTEWDITAIAQAWYSGALANNGLYLYAADRDIHTQTYWRSAEHGDMSQRPILEIEYVPEPTTMALLAGALAVIVRRKS